MSKYTVKRWEGELPATRQFSKYPWRSMQVGDYFTVPREEFVRARNAAASFAKRNRGWKFTTRLYGDSGYILRVK